MQPILSLASVVVLAGAFFVLGKRTGSQGSPWQVHGVRRRINVWSLAVFAGYTTLLLDDWRFAIVLALCVGIGGEISGLVGSAIQSRRERRRGRPPLRA